MENILIALIDKIRAEREKGKVPEIIYVPVQANGEIESIEFTIGILTVGFKVFGVMTYLRKNVAEWIISESKKTRESKIEKFNQ